MRQKNDVQSIRYTLLLHYKTQALVFITLQPKRLFLDVYLNLKFIEEFFILLELFEWCFREDGGQENIFGTFFSVTVNHSHF